jgi:hypothetical protein
MRRAVEKPVNQWKKTRLLHNFNERSVSLMIVCLPGLDETETDERRNTTDLLQLSASDVSSFDGARRSVVGPRGWSAWG